MKFIPRLELFAEVHNRLRREGDFIKKSKLDLCLFIIGGRRKSKYKRNRLAVTNKEFEEFLCSIERDWGIVVVRPTRPTGLYTLMCKETKDQKHKNRVRKTFSPFIQRGFQPHDQRTTKRYRVGK